MAVGCDFRSVIFALSIQGGSATHTETLSHKMSKYLVYLKNSKTSCNCLTWRVPYKELYKPWKLFIADLIFLRCLFCYHGEELLNLKKHLTKLRFSLTSS